MTAPPRLFDWLLRRALTGSTRDAIRGDLLEELATSGNTQRARLRFRRQVLSVALRYGGRRQHETASPRGSTMELIRHELRFAIRSLLQRPSFSLMVVATLALGIGANTAIFSILHALVLRSLPVDDPGRLVLITRNQGNQVSQQYPLFRHYQAHSTTFEGVLAFRSVHARFTSAARTERISSSLVSGNYFRLLGIEPVLGTPIGDDDDSIPGSGGPRGPVAVLGYGFWMRQYGGQPGAIGTSILLNAQPFTIVGVAPAGFSGTEVGVSPDVFVPMTMVKAMIPGLGEALVQPQNHWLRIIGRLKQGVDVRQAEQELSSLLLTYNQEILRDPAVQKRDPNWARTLLQQRAALLPGSAGLSSLRQRYAQPLTVSMTVMALVLLIACANIANLTLSRAAARRQELAIRLGLGASRARLVGGLLTESLLLATGGALAGLLIARIGRDLLLTYLPVDQTLSAPLDSGVLFFTLGLSAGAALLFGLLPALQSTKVDVAPVLRDGGAGRSPRVPFRKGLVVFQVSLSLVVVIGAVLFVRSLQALLSIDTGFARQNILVASVDVSPGRSVETYRRLLEEMRRVPGVLAAGAADSGPLGTGTGWTIHVPGYVAKADEPRSSPWVGFISPDYFKTMMVPLVAGRDFHDGDLEVNAPLKMIVNETFARHYFAGENPVGRLVGLDRGKFDIEIVGVIRDTKYTGLRDEAIRMVYVPYPAGTMGRAIRRARSYGGRPAGIRVHLAGEGGRDRSRRAGLQHSHRRAGDRTLPAARAAGGHDHGAVRGAGAAPGRARPVRRAVVRRRAAHPGVRHPHRGRRGSAHHHRSGPARGRPGRLRRHRGRAARDLGARPHREQPALRRRRPRSREHRDCRRRSWCRGSAGRVVARAPRLARRIRSGPCATSDGAAPGSRRRAASGPAVESLPA